jgi:predicted aspartyl protease
MKLSALAGPAALASLLLGLAAGGAAPAARAGTVSDILANVDATSSCAAAGATVEEWTVTAYGLTGAERVVRFGDDVRVVSRLGPFLDQEGRYRGQGWQQNENGVTILTSHGAAPRRSVTSQTFLAALRDRARLRFVGTTGPSDAPAYVLDDAPARGVRRRIVVDGRAWVPVRVEIEVAGRRITMSAGEFSTHGRCLIPTHIHAADSLSASNDVDWKLADFRDATAADAAQLAIPPSDRALAIFPPGRTSVQLPAHFIGSYVFVRVELDGNPVDMLLDSGSNETAVDAKVARALGMHQYGKSVEIAAGRYAQSRVFLQTVRIGALTLHDIAAASLPFDFKPRPGARALGLLGFDLFADAVIHVDYEHKRVAAIARRAFHPGSLPEAVALPVSVDDGVPLARIDVNGGAARMVIDTGSPDTVLFSAFARERGGLHAESNGERASGVGGSLRIVPVQLDNIAIAGESFDKFVVQEAQDATSFEATGADGLLGYQFMRLFDWYFDEAGGAVYASPNGALEELKNRTDR